MTGFALLRHAHFTRKEFKDTPKSVRRTLWGVFIFDYEQDKRDGF